MRLPLHLFVVVLTGLLVGLLVVVLLGLLGLRVVVLRSPLHVPFSSPHSEAFRMLFLIQGHHRILSNSRHL